MDYMHFRSYASATARFTRPDNLWGNAQNPQSWNLYAYVKGNPVNFNDPTGHLSELFLREIHASPSDQGIGAARTADGTPSGDKNGEKQAQDVREKTEGKVQEADIEVTDESCKEESTGDPVTDARVGTLHPSIREAVRRALKAVCNNLGIQLRVTDAFRGEAAQTAALQAGNSNAAFGESYHNYGLAVDVVELQSDGTVNWNTHYSAIAYYFCQEGFAWGGEWRSIQDRPHFECSFGLNWKDLQWRAENGFVSEENYVLLK
jgi:hypothetical protein